MLDGAQDHRVLGAGDVIADQELLVELLRRTQPRIRDLDIAVRMLLIAHRHAHQVNHAPRQIADTHGLAHVEHEDLAPIGHGAGLDDELSRLGDGHEIADHLRVSDGHRPSRLDLLVEQGDHGARGGEHVAESHHAEARLRAATMQALQHHLGEALGRAHHVGRIDRLVGRDEHEGLDLGLVRSLGRVPGRDHIVVNALDHVLLDDRHVLVRGRVIDRLDPVGLEDLAHALLLVTVADQADELHVQGILFRESRAARARCCRGQARTSRRAPAASDPSR